MKPIARQLGLFDPFPLDPGAAPAAPTLRQVADAVRAAGLEALPAARRRADQARYQEVHARTALTRVEGMPFRWALNPYRGCTHACVYCYARKYQRYLELDGGDAFSEFILVKRNLAEVLSHELARPAWSREPVAVGTATNPYLAIEGHYQITRRSLEALVGSRTPFSLVTKGTLVVRDLDVLRKATAAAGCRVYVSVPSVNPLIWARLEPGAPPPAARLRAARTLVDAGVDASVLMMPLVPGLTATRASVAETLAALEQAGVPFAGASVARLDRDVRQYFLTFLEREYPDLVPGYRRLYRQARASRPYTERVSAMVGRARARLAGIRSGSRVDQRPPRSA